MVARKKLWQDWRIRRLFRGSFTGKRAGTGRIAPQLIPCSETLYGESIFSACQMGIIALISGLSMLITMLKSKIHRATITGGDLNYEGSISIDKNLLKAADIRPFELVHVVNINNGHRFETYAIEAKADSGQIVLNGAAARLGQPGDLIIILSYGQMTAEEADMYQPVVVKVDSKNKQIR